MRSAIKDIIYVTLQIAVLCGAFVAAMLIGKLFVFEAYGGSLDITAKHLDQVAYNLERLATKVEVMQDGQVENFFLNGVKTKAKVIVSGDAVYVITR